jgi:hypothetical protein
VAYASIKIDFFFIYFFFNLEKKKVKENMKGVVGANPIVSNGVAKPISRALGVV